MSTGHATDVDPVAYESHDRIAEIVLRRPAASNAIDMDLACALHAAVDRAAADPEVDVVLLRGEGRLFCAGGDLHAMAAAADRGEFLAALAAAAHGAVRALDALLKPVVVAVQGGAAGAGLSLVLGGDLVVAGTSARFTTAYTSVGLTPDAGLSWLLPRLVGQRRAIELLLLSESINAARALDLGIASTVCADGEVLETARAIAGRLAGRSAPALGQARQLVRSSWDHTLDEHLDLEAATIGRVSETAESVALIDAFLSRTVTA